MRDFFRSPLFRCLVCLILACCILVNVSPIRAEALPISVWVWLEASMVFASIMSGLGVSPIDELAEGFADTCNSCWDFVSLNYDFVTDDEKIAVWATGNDELPFMVDQEVIEAVRDWLFTSETLVEETADYGFLYYDVYCLPEFTDEMVSYKNDGYRTNFIRLVGDYYLFTMVNADPIIEDSRTLKFNAPVALAHFKYNAFSPVEWSFDSSSTHSSGWIGPYTDLLWCNVFDGEPSDTYTLTAEDYLTLNYVAPSEMDFSTGYSTWTAGAISVPGVRAEEGEETVVVPLSIPGTAADVYSFSQADVWAGANTAADVIAQAVPITGTGTADPTLPVVPDVPTEIAPYTFSLNDIFPFCIPFDLYDFLTCLNAAPVAPVIHWEIQLPGGGSYPLDLDLSPFDSVAQLLRRLQLLAFCIALGIKTRDLIKG